VVDEPVVEQGDLPAVVAGFRADLGAGLAPNRAAARTVGPRRALRRTSRAVRLEVLHAGDLRQVRGVAGAWVSSGGGLPFLPGGFQVGGDAAQVSGPVCHGRPLPVILEACGAYLITETVVLFTSPGRRVRDLAADRGVARPPLALLGGGALRGGYMRVGVRLEGDRPAGGYPIPRV
jgi:hypothetical protein